jgi:hypothetical protein
VLVAGTSRIEPTPVESRWQGCGCVVVQSNACADCFRLFSWSVLLGGGYPLPPPYPYPPPYLGDVIVLFPLL